MSAPSVDDLPQVVDPAVLTGLGERLVSIANATQTSMADVQNRWSVLGDTEVFHVTGAGSGAAHARPPRFGCSEFLPGADRGA